MAQVSWLSKVCFEALWGNMKASGGQGHSYKSPAHAFRAQHGAGVAPSLWEMRLLHFTPSCLSLFLIFHTERTRTYTSGIYWTEPKNLLYIVLCFLIRPSALQATTNSVFYFWILCLSSSTKAKTMISDANIKQWVLNADAIPGAFLKDVPCIKLTVLV